VAAKTPTRAGDDRAFVDREATIDESSAWIAIIRSGAHGRDLGRGHRHIQAGTITSALTVTL